MEYANPYSIPSLILHAYSMPFLSPKFLNYNSIGLRYGVWSVFRASCFL